MRKLSLADSSTSPNGVNHAGALLARETGPEMREGVLEEVAYLEMLPDFACSALASLVPMSVDQLRHIILKGCYASFAYLESHVFSIVLRAPWKLWQAAVLRALAEASACPEDPVSRKLWLWLQAGLFEEKVVQAVELLSQSSFSSFIAEKQHASAATLKRFHSEMGPATLSQRAFLHGFRQLLGVSTHTHTNARILRLRQRLRKELHKNPDRITGRHVFYSDVVTKMHTKKQGQEGRPG
eukprot:6481406-Amphidinium_carterae.4